MHRGQRRRGVGFGRRSSRGVRAGSGGAAASTLLDSLVSWWSLDEASGTRVDSHGSNDLTDNNTVGQAAGKVGSAASFVAANSEYLSRADNASLSMGAGVEMTVAAWAKTASDPATNVPVAVHADGWYLDCGASVRYRLFIVGATSGTALVEAGNQTVGEWQFVVAWYDLAKLYIQVNLGTIFEAAFANGIKDSAQEFRIGGRADAALYWNGDIDEVALWKRVLTADERSELYNSGDGIAYPG